MKRPIACLLLAALLLLAAVPSLAEEATGLSWYFQYYFDQAPADDHLSAAKVSAPAVEWEGIRVAFDEMLSDGEWLFTSARVECLDPDVMLIPGSAGCRDAVGIAKRDAAAKDTRSFLTAAQEENKRLRAVYVYPAAFDACGTYFLDHLFLADDSFFMLSGACFPIREKAEVLWGIQLYDVDQYSGQYTLIGTKEVPVACSPLTAPEETLWSLDMALPLTGIRRINTCLATYLYPIWRSEEEQYACNYLLVDSAGAPLEPVSMPMWDAYTLDKDETFHLLLLPTLIPQAN